mmetsp:Transcript_33699/g.66583  ORF Transcript_33699/g.66583 Transcript_33699/m.66583 type:complete len:257 (+) Transcript_33699:817-1587(+)
MDQSGTADLLLRDLPRGRFRHRGARGTRRRPQHSPPERLLRGHGGDLRASARGRRAHDGFPPPAPRPGAGPPRPPRTRGCGHVAPHAHAAGGAARARRGPAGGGRTPPGRGLLPGRGHGRARAHTHARCPLGRAQGVRAAAQHGQDAGGHYGTVPVRRDERHVRHAQFGAGAGFSRGHARVHAVSAGGLDRVPAPGGTGRTDRPGRERGRKRRDRHEHSGTREIGRVSGYGDEPRVPVHGSGLRGNLRAYCGVWGR